MKDFFQEAAKARIQEIVQKAMSKIKERYKAPYD